LCQDPAVIISATNAIKTTKLNADIVEVSIAKLLEWTTMLKYGHVTLIAIKPLKVKINLKNTSPLSKNNKNDLIFALINSS
jgi:hypothetical protein